MSSGVVVHDHTGGFSEKIKERTPAMTFVIGGLPPDGGLLLNHSPVSSRVTSL